MEPGEEEDRIRQILWDNRMLKQRVLELEEKIRRLAPPGGEAGQPPSSILKLLGQKDQKLERYAAELEQKRDELQKMVEELEERNRQLSLWMSTLRLYHEIFENDLSVMIGVNPDGRVILFNRAAPQILGEKFKAALHREIEAVDFSSFDPSTPEMVRQALRGPVPPPRTVRVRDRVVTTSVFPLGSEKDIRGALVRITVASEKQL